MNATAHLHRQRGLTLIEGCIALAVAAVVLGTALPSFQQARERRHLEGLAAQLRTDIAHARSLAAAQNGAVRIAFGSAGACYVVHTGPSGGCSCTDDGKARCQDGAALLRHVAAEPSAGVTLASNTPSMLFDGDRGTVTPTGTVKLTGRSGAEIRSIVNLMGRVRNCSPAPALPGYPKC